MLASAYAYLPRLLSPKQVKSYEKLVERCVKLLSTEREATVSLKQAQELLTYLKNHLLDPDNSLISLKLDPDVRVALLGCSLSAV